MDDEPRPKKRKGTGVLYVRNLDEAVKLMFQATCVRRKTKMKTAIERCMRVYIRFPERFEPTPGRHSRIKGPKKADGGV